jgi:hypothetical protein
MEFKRPLTNDNDLELLKTSLEFEGINCDRSAIVIILGSIDVSEENIELFKAINKLLPAAYEDIKELVDMKLRKYYITLDTFGKGAVKNIYYVPEGTFAPIDMTQSLPITGHEVAITAAKQEVKVVEETFEKIKNAIEALDSTVFENNEQTLTQDSVSSDPKYVLKNLHNFTMFELLDIVEQNADIYSHDYIRDLLGFYVPKYHCKHIHGSKLISKTLGMLFGIPKRIIKAQNATRVSVDHGAYSVIKEHYIKYDTNEFSREKLLLAIITDIRFNDELYDSHIYYITNTAGMDMLIKHNSWVLFESEKYGYNLYKLIG